MNARSLALRASAMPVAVTFFLAGVTAAYSFDGASSSSAPVGTLAQGDGGGDETGEEDGGGGRPNSPERNRTSDSGPVSQRDDDPERDEPGVFDNIPLGGLLIALAIAALIGVVGGHVYAGIMGPRV